MGQIFKQSEEEEDELREGEAVLCLMWRCGCVDCDPQGLNSGYTCWCACHHPEVSR